MDYHFLVYLICLLGVLAIAYWAVTKMGLPQPFQIVIVVVVAIIAIMLLMQIAGGGGIGSLGLHSAHGCP